MYSLKSFFVDYPVKKFSKGEMIVPQDGIPQKVYAVKQGIIKVYNLTRNGEEKSITFKVDEDIFPVCWTFSKTAKALFYYQAHTDCELYAIDKQVFTHQVHTSPKFALALLNSQVNSYVSSALQLNALGQTRASTKLLCTFRHLCLRHGRDVKPDRVKIEVPLTQQELANYVGLTRETTVVELNKLKQQEVIAYKHKYYTVNTAKLNELIDDEYDPGVVFT